MTPDNSKKVDLMNCDICKATSNLLSGQAKDRLRRDWQGVDFYSAICVPCWEVEKARR
jgi:hypothetical protein